MLNEHFAFGQWLLTLKPGHQVLIRDRQSDWKIKGTVDTISRGLIRVKENRAPQVLWTFNIKTGRPFFHLIADRVSICPLESA